MFCKKDILKNFVNLTEKDQLINKVAFLGICDFIKKDSDTHAFLRNLQNF